MTEQEQKAFTAMREALEQAHDMVDHWGLYASEYFQKKHDLAGDLSKIKAALTAANAVSDQDLPVGKCGVLSKSEPQAQGDLQALDESDIEDLARSSFESAMAFGVDLNSYTKLAKHVWEKMRAHPQATEPAAKESLTIQDIDTCRQWFDSVQDTNGGYLTLADYVLADKIYRTLGMRVPSSITAMLAAAPEAKQ